jgi:hypothetical protein
MDADHSSPGGYGESSATGGCDRVYLLIPRVLSASAKPLAQISRIYMSAMSAYVFGPRNQQQPGKPAAREQLAEAAMSLALVRGSWKNGHLLSICALSALTGGWAQNSGKCHLRPLTFSSQFAPVQPMPERLGSAKKNEKFSSQGCSLTIR